MLQNKAQQGEIFHQSKAKTEPTKRRRRRLLPVAILRTSKICSKQLSQQHKVHKMQWKQTMKTRMSRNTKKMKQITLITTLKLKIKMVQMTMLRIATSRNPMNKMNLTIMTKEITTMKMVVKVLYLPLRKKKEVSSNSSRCKIRTILGLLIAGQC